MSYVYRASPGPQQEGVLGAPGAEKDALERTVASESPPSRDGVSVHPLARANSRDPIVTEAIYGATCTYLDGGRRAASSAQSRK